MSGYSKKTFSCVKLKDMSNMLEENKATFIFDQFVLEFTVSTNLLIVRRLMNLHCLHSSSFGKSFNALVINPNTSMPPPIIFFPNFSIRETPSSPK